MRGRRSAKGGTGAAGRGGGSGPPPIRLDIAVRNLGPVARGSVAIRPLTILIGPNNSGKSYVATMLRSILTAQRDVAGARWRLADSESAPAFRSLLAQKHGKNRRRMAVTGAESGRVMRSLLAGELCPVLEEQIAWDFGSEPRGLARDGSGDTAAVDISERDPRTGRLRKLSVALGGRLSARAVGMASGYVIEAPPGSPGYSVAAAAPAGRQDGTARKDGRQSQPQPEVDAIGLGPDTDPRRLSNALAMDIMERISAGIAFRAAPRHVYHIPPAASGMLQVPSALDPDTVASGRHGGGAQGMAGAAGDLLSELALGEMTSGPFSSLAESMDNELFGGSIRLDAPAGGGCREIAYYGDEGRVPLRRCSSAISSIAPLSLHLKHVVGRGDLLVIEEPDEHLHPKAHLVLAKYLVRLVRDGAGVLVTTHSIFLLEKLAKYLMVGDFAPEERSKVPGYGRDDYLAPDEVSAYVFEPNAGGGYRTSPVERDEEYGISQEEFVRVNEVLYQDTITIGSIMEARGGE